jgi:hypothetical protein
MMKKWWMSIGLLSALLLLGGCNGTVTNNDKNVSTFMKIVSISSDSQHPMLGIDIEQNIFVYGNTFLRRYTPLGQIQQAQLMDHGIYRRLFWSDQFGNDLGFGNAVTINSYAFISASDITNRAYLYPLDKYGNISLDAPTVIDSIDASLPYRRKVVLDGHRFLINAYQPYDNGLATLYSFESNGSVTLLNVLSSTDLVSRFGYDIAMKDNHIAVSENKGCRVHLYTLDTSGTVLSSRIVIPSFATVDANCLTKVALGDDYLLIGSAYFDQVSLIPLSGEEVAVTPPESLADGFGYTLDADGNNFVVESKKGFSLFTYSNGKINLQGIYQDSNDSWHIGGEYSGIHLKGERVARIYHNGAAAHIYTLHPKYFIYVYNYDPQQSIYLKDGTPPSDFHCFDAETVDGTISISLSGDDAQWFTMDGKCLQNIETLYHDHPVDKNGDNIYSLEFTIHDGSGHDLTKPINIIVLPQ